MKIHWRDLPKVTSIGEYETNQSIDDLLEHLEYLQTKKNLNLSPDFQRGHVWNENQKILFIEYILKGGNINTTIYFNRNNIEFIIVDGLQRLTAVIEFLNNKITVFTKYKALDINLMNLTSLKFNINNLKTKKEVLTWYLEINENSTPHTKQELDRIKNLIEIENNI
jgi:uncharacterized protein with ParB-like and HNH nuclease domain